MKNLVEKLHSLFHKDSTPFRLDYVDPRKRDLRLESFNTKTFERKRVLAATPTRMHKITSKVNSFFTKLPPFEGQENIGDENELEALVNEVIFKDGLNPNSASHLFRHALIQYASGSFHHKEIAAKRLRQLLDIEPQTRVV